jgi:hypothetical protein
MKRDYKFFLFLAGGLVVSLSTLFRGLPAASEEAQILPPQVLPSCLEKLPILESDSSTSAETIPVSSTVSSPIVSDPAAPLPVPQIDPNPTTEIPQIEIPKADQSSKTSQSLLPSAPLSVPSVEPPTTSQSTSLLKPLYKSLPTAPPPLSDKLPIEPLAQSVIPASPLLPFTAVPNATATEETPHTRYLPTPPNSTANPVTSVAPDNQPTSLDPDSSVSQPSNLSATIGCAPAVDSAPVLDNAQTEVLPKTAKTESPASPNNSDIEKSIENSQRSLNGLRPF